MDEQQPVVNRLDAEDCAACVYATDVMADRSACDYHEGLADGMAAMSRWIKMAADEPEIVAAVEWQRQQRARLAVKA